MYVGCKPHTRVTSHAPWYLTSFVILSFVYLPIIRFRHTAKHISTFSRENHLCFGMCAGLWASLWTFFIRDVKNELTPSVIFIITFIYMMRNTAVFFCTRIVQMRFREPFIALSFLNFEWSPEWESPDSKFHRTVLLFFGVFIIARIFPVVNMANCKKCAFNFCWKSRSCAFC